MTQRDRCLAMLRRGPTTTGEFCAAYLPRFPARLLELKDEGFVIERTRNSASSFTYTLISGPVRPGTLGAVVSPSGPVPPTREQPPQAPTLFEVEHRPLGAYEEAAA